MFANDAMVLLLADEMEKGKITSPCGVVISPVAKCEITLYDEDGTRIVYDGTYGSLPDSTLVVAVDNSDGAWPEGLEIKVRVVTEPYNCNDCQEVHDFKLSFISGEEPCPICEGREEEEDGSKDDDGDDDSGGDNTPEPPVHTGPTNRIAKYLKPSS